MSLLEPASLGMGLALLAAGVLLGGRWARHRGSGAPRQRADVRPHYLLGLIHLVSRQPQEAIRELSQAVREETDAIEAHLTLGNLLRENGQTERAIGLHKSLLHRRRLASWERSQVLFSLALDFQAAGLVDRAERTLREVSQREPAHCASLEALRRIYEETGRWAEAVALQERIQRLEGHEHPDLLPRMHVEWARSLLAHDPGAAQEHLQQAMRYQPDDPAAAVLMGRCLLAQGEATTAITYLERAVASPGPWAQAALDPLEQACSQTGRWESLERSCQSLVRREPDAWRAWVLLARRALARDDLTAAARAAERALQLRPSSVSVQRELWAVLQRRDEGMAEFLGFLDRLQARDPWPAEPFMCLRCRFRSPEMYCRCPHCHAWDSMAEERTG